MTHLAILLHADERVRARYENAIAERVDGDVELLLVVSPFGAFSSGYRQLMRHVRSRCPGSYLKALADYAGAAPLSSYETVTIASFSAGYAAVQAMLGEPASASGIDCVVAIDSWHTALERDGTANDSQLAGLVRYGLRAAEEPIVCWYRHTDVRTPQKGPQAFASTTQVAEELRRLTGLLGTTMGGLCVEAVNLHVSDHKEHVAALCDWGDEWLADAMAELLTRRVKMGVDIPDAAPTLPSEPLGIRALGVAVLERERGVSERPGLQHNARIQLYHSIALRNGAPVLGPRAPDEVPWCASFASFCMATAAIEGEVLPHRPRCAVRELWTDAIASGAARGVSRVRRGEWVPNHGDLVIWTRGATAAGEGDGAFSRSRGLGHVGRLRQWNGDRFDTIDGNKNDAIRDVDGHHVGDQHLVGFIAYPQLTADVTPPTDEELDALRWLDAAALMRISRDVERGYTGMDVVEDLMQ